MALEVDIYDFNQSIEDFAIAKINEIYPDIDTSDNATFKKLYIDPTVQIASEVISHVNDVDLKLNLSNYESMDIADIDALGEGNYGIVRRQGTKTVGQVTFSISGLTESSLSIPAGTGVSTADGLTFFVSHDYNYTAIDLISVFDSSTSVYKIPVLVEAEEVGSKYGVDAYTITSIGDDFTTAYCIVTNEVAFNPGLDEETAFEYINRIYNYYKTRNLGTEDGYKAFIKETRPEVKEVYVAGKDNILMTRDLITILQNNVPTQIHFGGCIDFYLQNMNRIIMTERVIATVNNIVIQESNIVAGSVLAYSIDINGIRTLISNPTVNIYTANTQIQLPVGTTGSVVISYQIKNDDNTLTTLEKEYTIMDIYMQLMCPVIEVLEVRNENTGTTLSTDTYQIVTYSDIDLDGTSDERKSIKIAPPSNTINGDSIAVTYVFNDTIYSLAEYFNTENNRLICKSLLFKMAPCSYVNLRIRYKKKDDVTYDGDIDVSMVNAASDVISKKIINQRVLESEILTALNNIPNIFNYVDYFVSPLPIFYKSNTIPTTLLEQRDGFFLEPSTAQYLTVGNIMVERI